MNRKLIIGICLLSTFNAYSQVKTDTTKVEEVIITENRLSIPFNKTARNIQVITREEIDKLPVKSINELLTYVGGVDVRQRGPFGTQADISMDGGTFEQTLILLNGVKLLDAQTAHNSMNIPVPLEAIERIEVLKGPAARIYGINALTGAINIVTKKSPASFLNVNTYAGSSFLNKAAGDGAGIYGGGGLQLTGNIGTEKMQHLIAASKDLYNGQRYNSAADNSRFFYNGNLNINEKNSIQAMAGYTYNKFGANGFYAAPGDVESEEIVETVLASIASKHKIGKALTISPRISNRYNEDDYRYYRNNPSLARSMHYSNALMAELNGSLRTKIGEFGLGFESRFEVINSSNIGKHDRTNHGMFAEYKNAFWNNKIMTNIGAYVNYNSSYGWQVYPGVDLAYLFLPNWKLAFNVGSSQRIPSFTDLYLQQKGNIGNPNLKPEDAIQYEASLHYRYKKITAQAGYFYRDITNFIDWTRTSTLLPYQAFNLGNNRTHGIYARMSQQLKINENQQIGYSISFQYLEPKHTEYASNVTSKYVLENLRHQLIGGINYTIKNFGVQWNHRYIQRALNTPYYLMDIRMQYKLNAFTIYTDIYNILDTKYKEAGAVPMPTRWFTIGFIYKLQVKKN